MKKLLAVSTILALNLISTVTFADTLATQVSTALASTTTPTTDTTTTTPSDTGVYFGIEGGYGLTNWSDQDTPSYYKVTKDGGVVGRVFLGYDVNKYFAAEFGYSYFFNKARVMDSSNSNNYTQYTKTQAADLLGKGKLPVTDKLNVCVKLGISYLMTSAQDQGGWVGLNSQSPKKFNVAYGAGADYSITSRVIANIEWLHYKGNPKWNDGGNFLPDADAFMAGLRYRFNL